MSVGSIIARGNSFMGSQLFSETQRAAIMPRVARGEYLGALALSEPNTGSDLANVSCRARRRAPTPAHPPRRVGRAPPQGCLHPSR